MSFNMSSLIPSRNLPIRQRWKKFLNAYPVMRPILGFIGIGVSWEAFQFGLQYMGITLPFWLAALIALLGFYGGTYIVLTFVFSWAPRNKHLLVAILLILVTISIRDQLIEKFKSWRNPKSRLADNANNQVLKRPIRIVGITAAFNSKNTDQLIANIYFLNSGPDVDLTPSLAGAVADSDLKQEVQQEIIKGLQKQGLENGEITTRIRSGDTKYFTVPGPVLSPDQKMKYVKGGLAFYFAGRTPIRIGDKELEPLEFCSFVIGNNPKVVVDCPVNVDAKKSQVNLSIPSKSGPNEVENQSIKQAAVPAADKSDNALKIRFGLQNGMHWETQGGSTYFQFIVNLLNLSKSDPVILDFRTYYKFGGDPEPGTQTPSVHLLPQPGELRPNPLSDQGVRIEPLNGVDVVFQVFADERTPITTGLLDHEILLIAMDRISNKSAAQPITCWTSKIPKSYYDSHAGKNRNESK